MKKAIYFGLMAGTLCILFGCAQDSSSETVKDSEKQPVTDESTEESGLEQGVSQLAEGYAPVPEEGDTISAEKEKEIYLYMKSYTTGKSEGQNTQDAITQKASKKFGITQEQADTLYRQFEMELYKPK
ncbi:hypothetical protein [Peribacillus sp. NPDC097295]|uniref:hypothetical protein n=1 Tax=Peribacillus sp. NPDC097295 TaxID=3364402 RepID=UPI00380CA445